MAQHRPLDKFWLQRDIVAFSKLLVVILAFSLRADFAQTKERPLLPGCEKIATFNPADEFDREPAKCFCDTEPDKTDMTISCLWGANTTVIAEVLEKARKKGVALEHFFLSAGGLLVNDSEIPDFFFKDIKINGLIIQDCATDLYLHENALAGLAGPLENLTISKCHAANETYFDAIRKVPSVRNLVLTRDDILTLPEDAFANFANLRQLDLSANYMRVIHPGAFNGLSEKLEELSLGPGNELNETQLEELGKLTKLKKLVLSKNKLRHLAPHTFSPLKNLESLDLILNSLKNLTADAFTGLEKLKLLDLRVSNVYVIIDGAFNGLPRLEALLLAGNYIVNTTKDTFGLLKKLKQLDLSRNELEDLHSQTFDRLKALEVLDLSANTNLKYMPRGLLSKLSKLKELSVSETDLEHLEPDTFISQGKLEKLSLSKTSLYSIDAETFKPLSSLKQLLLNASQLQSIGENAFDAFEHTIQYIDLSGNPWVCDQKLKWIVTFLQNLAKNKPDAIGNADSIRCAQPAKFRNRPLLQLQPELLTDEIPITTTRIITTPKNITVRPPTTKSNRTLFPRIGAQNHTTMTTTTRDWKKVVLPQAKPEAVENSGASSAAATTGSANSTGLIVGVVVAAVVVAAIVITAILIMLKRRRKSRSVGSTVFANGSNDQSSKAHVVDANGKPPAGQDIPMVTTAVTNGTHNDSHVNQKPASDSRFAVTKILPADDVAYTNERNSNGIK